MQFQQIHDDVWTTTAPLTMLGLHLGTRMTVVRLPSGGLWVHSPIPLDAEAHEHQPHLASAERCIVGAAAIPQA